MSIIKEESTNTVNMKAVEDRKKFSQENLNYSFKRMDTLIITIAGGGIYTCLTTIKFLIQYHNHNLNGDVNWLINTSGTMFAISIIANFASQYTGAKANEYDFLMCEEEIKAAKKPKKDLQERIDEFDKRSESYSKYTDRLNVVSIGFLGVGLIALTIFYWIIF